MKRLCNIVRCLVSGGWCLVFGVWCLVFCSGCRNEQVSDDPSLRLTFSQDTLRFDTVFTTVGSATQSVTIYNPNPNAVIISKVTQEQRRYFSINLDGENDLRRLTDLRINGKDSLILFVNVYIDPQDQNTPVLVEDAVVFETNGNTQTLRLEAYGQDVEKIRSQAHKTVLEDYTFTAVKPYLIYDTLQVTGALDIQPGARLYFHQGASLIAEGSVTIGFSGSPTLLPPYSSTPILCAPDRIDNLFDSVPYAYSAGGWDGFYIRHSAGGSDDYYINGLNLISATNGLQVINEDTTIHHPQSTIHNSPSGATIGDSRTIHISNSRIHNHVGNGLTLCNIDALVTNTEISNCGQFCVYLMGGKHTFIHSTIAAYFNSTNVRIQSTINYSLSGAQSTAVYVDNADSLPPVTAEFMNCVITGLGTQNIYWADTIREDYEGRIFGNYLKTDTIHHPTIGDSRTIHNNVYWTKEDTAQVFVNTFFEYQKYDYYDFHLAEFSPARGIADSTITVLYPFDKDGLSRPASHANAGCYEK